MWEKLRTHNYIKDQKGQFAVIMALLMSIVLMAIGVAVDSAGATRYRTQIQSVTDAAALAAAVSGETDLATLKKIAKQSAAQNVTLDRPLSLNVSLNNDRVFVEATYKYETSVMGILGMKFVSVTTESEAPMVSDYPLNIALVLDRTGSMSGQNMTDLKTASQSLIDIFEAQEPGHVRASVVPFAQYVNVGMANRSQPWMDVPADTSETKEYCYNRRDLEKPELCTEHTGTGYNDGVPYTYTYRTCPAEAYGEYYEYCYMATYSDTWRGCAGSRDEPHNSVPEYDLNPIPGVMDYTCGQEMLELTSNMVDVESKIQSLTASGQTYIPTGLLWGWRTLDAAEPFDDITNIDPDRRKILVLMTDGQNTVYKYNEKHYSLSPTSSTYETKMAETNALMMTICDGIKADDIEIYSIAYKFDLADAGAKDLVRDCATSTSHFFDAENADQLEAAFIRIGNSMDEVRLSK